MRDYWSSEEIDDDNEDADRLSGQDLVSRGLQCSFSARSAMTARVKQS